MRAWGRKVQQDLPLRPHAPSAAAAAAAAAGGRRRAGLCMGWRRLRAACGRPLSTRRGQGASTTRSCRWASTLPGCRQQWRETSLSSGRAYATLVSAAHSSLHSLLQHCAGCGGQQRACGGASELLRESLVQSSLVQLSAIRHQLPRLREEPQCSMHTAAPRLPGLAHRAAACLAVLPPTCWRCWHRALQTTPQMAGPGTTSRSWSCTATRLWRRRSWSLWAPGRSCASSWASGWTATGRVWSASCRCPGREGRKKGRKEDIGPPLWVQCWLRGRAELLGC